jgi:subtilase family serine protease
MRTIHAASLGTLLLAAAACTAPGATLAPPQHLSAASAAQQTSGGPTLDLGSTDPTQTVSVSIVFKAKHSDDLEQFVQDTTNPWSPRYRQFLSVQQFANRYSPSTKDIARVSAYLATFGITVGQTLADDLVLKATGTVGAFTQAFTFQVHDFQAPNGARYHRPTSSPSVPHALSDVMLVVAGFNTQPAFLPKSVNAAAVAPGFTPKKALPPAGSTATGVPGSYTVGDFANQYDVGPLYKQGVDGTGSTIGIATMAGFLPADAYTYWSTIGLDVGQSRITQVHVDEGAPIGARAGTGETSLDVEQSGGIAPGANLVVYDAPNTDGGFLDLFYQAASDNLADSLSISWGGSEMFYNAGVAGIDLTPELQAFHQAFLELAAQGISTFAASGDDGAYDLGSFGPGYTNPLTVDYPASDPAMTAAGGTTTPYTISASDFGAPGTATFSVTQEQVWGWDSLQTFYVANVDPTAAGSFFSTGSGGGVSSYWPLPYYQRGTRGLRVTEANQVFSFTDPATGAVTTYDTLPAGFVGRNTPDISADADPFSGYSVYDQPDGGWSYGYGGTSFVAPQLNGVTALLKQSVGGRIGFWNPQLYRIAQHRRGGAVVDVTGGDNWFYAGVPGYEPGAGLGRVDVAALAKALADDCDD